MPSFVTDLELIRKNQTFKAVIARVEGKWEDLAMQVAWLHPKEKEVYNAFQYKKRKKSYLLGRLAAKEAILNLTNQSDPTTIAIESGVFQFPVVKGESNIQVSISHSENIGVAIAFPEAHPMGIDIEQISQDRIALFASQMTNREILLLKERTKESPVHYTAIFSVKEALSKVLRTGMMLDFKILEIKDLLVKQDRIECTFCNFGQYRGIIFISNKYYVTGLVLPLRTDIDLGLVQL